MKKILDKIKGFLNGLKNSDPKPTKVQKVTKKDIQEYYAQAKGWSYDIFDSIVVSRDRWKLFGFIAVAFIFLQIFVILSMLPLRTVVPMIVHEDRNGVVWVEAPNSNMSGQHISVKDKAEIKSDLYFFVQAFESYDPYTTLKIARQYVQNMATTQVYTQFEEQLANPDSYFTKLGAKGSRKITVQAISILSLASKKNPDNTALVRFQSEEKNNLGVVSDVRQWQATVVWRYNGVPKNPVKQFINYHGFEVLDYKVVPFDQGN